ncbi:regulatory protein RecX [Tenacibaculum sp. SG-28]|uniref:regulatory protein RecX n=1 Tax=Tenacibaculum sp. SG-28 TaxID=754426 RepID=UPI000CF43CAF|nr:regulatory protein RecX [Tenacibaculum sp. SG-28]PQJ21557.1 recombinase RecX [Tenacibaculum sp. SG-28]
MHKRKVYTVEEIKQKLERYCIYQDRCHKDVEQKMFAYGLIPEAREHILLHLLENNFLNEERFAKSFARGKFRIKKWGRERISRELKLRDISAYNLKIALKEIEEEEYLCTLQALYEKRNESLSEENEFKRNKKLFDYLKYRGYETNLIVAVINQDSK